MSSQRPTAFEIKFSETHSQVLQVKASAKKEAEANRCSIFHKTGAMASRQLTYSCLNLCLLGNITTKRVTLTNN